MRAEQSDLYLRGSREDLPTHEQRRRKSARSLLHIGGCVGDARAIGGNTPQPTAKKKAASRKELNFSRNRSWKTGKTGWLLCVSVCVWESFVSDGS